MLKISPVGVSVIRRLPARVLVHRRGMGVIMRMHRVVVGMRVNVKLPSRDALADTALKVRMHLAAQTERRQCVLKNGLFHPRIPQGPHRHVTADTGKTIEIKNTHGSGEIVSHEAPRQR